MSKAAKAKIKNRIRAEMLTPGFTFDSLGAKIGCSGVYVRNVASGFNDNFGIRQAICQELGANFWANSRLGTKHKTPIPA